MKNSKPKLLAVISDIWTSELILEILRQASISYDVHLIYFSEISSDFLLSFKEFGAVSKEIKVKSFLLRLLATSWFILKNRRKMKPDLIFASGLVSTYSCVLPTLVSSKTRFYYTRHHSNAHWSSGRFIWMLFDKMAFSVATKIIAVSNVVHNCLHSEGCPISKIVTIWNGINLESFFLVRKSRKTISQSRVVRIGVVSRLERWKGVQHTLEAVLNLMTHNTIESFRFEVVIAGADYFPIDEQIQYLLKRADELQILERLKWQSDMSSFYQQIDVLIHVPESDLAEAFGMVYIEGLACGVPMIATISGVLKDCLELQNYVQKVRYQNSLDIESALIHLTEIRLQQIPHDICPENLLENFYIHNVCLKYVKVFESQNT